MKYWQYFLLTISLSSLVACGGGGSGGGSNSTVNPTESNSNLSKSTLVYNKAPRLNESITLNIEDYTSETTIDYIWQVVKSPASSNLQLTVSSDTKSIQFIPIESGQYILSATPATGEVLETQFLIVKEFPINSAKLIGYDDSVELSKQSGMISNQAWIYSKTLSQSAIQAIVNNHPSVTTLDFDVIRGLLVQYDETSTQSQNSMNTIKTTTGIDSVNRRFFEGENSTKDSLKIVDDGSRFDDGGDNWHLEHIGIEKAWDISTGNTDFLIGISEANGLFHTEHEDLKGRFKQATKATISNVLDEDIVDGIGTSYHATAVAGAIGGISNNKKGISGINWSNLLEGTTAGYDSLLQLLDKKTVPLINNSWSMVGHPPEEHDPENSFKVDELSNEVYEKTRDYRNLATFYNDTLFVYGAGNGIKNGLGFKGAYGIDGKQANPSLHYNKNKQDVSRLEKQPNVIFVSALLIDKRLAFYSNFGESVDIAAPTGYKSTKLDIPDIPFLKSFDQYYDGENYGINTKSAGFQGTSAAAPVVTGVASLILAVDETFTPTEIKDILVNSATAFVTERYKHPGNEDEGFFGPGAVGSLDNIESLSYPIPILNAAAALTMAKQIKDDRDESNNQVGEATLLTPIIPLTTSESATIPGNGTLPSFSVLEETGTDGDIDQELFLKEGVSSIQAVDIQRDHGISVICEDGIQKPFSLNAADYSTSTITDTFYENGQVAASCSSNHAPILPVTLTNANISDVLEDWGGEPVSSGCPITTDIPNPNPNFNINTACSSVSLRNFLITDTSGKEHKVSIQFTTEVID